MKQIKGDLIKLAKEGEFDLIVHGCNCFHTMGSGIALQLKKEWPILLEKDTSETTCGDINKLGTSTDVFVTENLLVVNAYTQYGYGIGKHVDYAAVDSVFTNIAEVYKDCRIGYPKIGAGLGGGDWELIAEIIDKALDGLDHTLVVFEN